MTENYIVTYSLQLRHNTAIVLDKEFDLNPKHYLLVIDGISYPFKIDHVNSPKALKNGLHIAGLHNDLKGKTVYFKRIIP